MPIDRRYGIQDTVYFRMVKRGVVDLATSSDWTPVQSDARIQIDDASESYATNVVTATGSRWALVMTAANLTGKKIGVTIIDAATKAVEDNGLEIETYGSPLAQHPFDRSVSTVTLSQPALDAAATQIVNTVWATGSRTLTGLGTAVITADAIADSGASEIATAVWATGSRTLTSLGTGVIDAASIADSGASEIAIAVWATGSRTLTSLGTGVIDAASIADSGASEIAIAVWATSSRTLSSFGTLQGDIVNNVWATPSRTLTSLGTGVIDANSIADSGASEIATAVWATGSRTLSSFGTLQLDIVNNVWATPSRTLTSLGTGVIDANAIADSGASEIATAVWATGSRTLSSFGTLQGDIVNNVWATPSRTLSSFGTLQGDIVNNVWATGSRTLSSFGTLQADIVNNVWATPSRTITGTGTDAIAAASIAAAAGSKIADIVLRRTAANARASSDGDTVAFRSLLGATSKLVNKVAMNGANLEIMEENDSTVFGTQAATTDSSAAAITALDTS